MAGRTASFPIPRVTSCKNRHLPRLEKLLDILRNKVIDAADGEQSKDPGNPGSVRARRAGTVSGLAADEDAEQREDDEDGDEEASFREKVAALVENGMKVSGPVTDL